MPPDFQFLHTRLAYLKVLFFFPCSILLNQHFIFLYLFLPGTLSKFHVTWVPKEIVKNRNSFGFPSVKSLSPLVFVTPSNTKAYHTSSLLKIQKLAKILPQPGVGPAEEVPDVCLQGVHNLVRIKQH